jgi:hypothetical protein
LILKQLGRTKWIVVPLILVAAIGIGIDAASSSFFYSVQGDMCRKAIQHLSPIPTADERAALLDCGQRSNGIYRATIAEGLVAAALAVLAAWLTFRASDRG